VRPHDLLDIQDVLGKRGIETGLRGRVTVREENAAALRRISDVVEDVREEDRPGLSALMVAVDAIAR
jgi:hypothetical protein